MVRLSPVKDFSRSKDSHKGSLYLDSTMSETAVGLTEPISFRMVGKPEVIVRSGLLA